MNKNQNIYIFLFCLNMLLAIDIGNTDIVFAINSNDQWIHHWREKSDTSHHPGSFALNLKNYFLENDLRTGEVKTVVLSSVVPDLTSVIQSTVMMVFDLQPLVVAPGIYGQLTIKTSNPLEIGSDLVANAAAAYAKTKDYCIVVDFGTALTFTTISDQGRILGVAIAPGLKTAMKSLSGNTAQLPEIPLELPDSVLGKNTVHAMQAGILHGYVGLVKSMIDNIRNEVEQPCKVIATGGLSAVLTPLHAHFDEINPLLTLDGLKVIAGQVKSS